MAASVASFHEVARTRIATPIGPVQLLAADGTLAVILLPTAEHLPRWAGDVPHVAADADPVLKEAAGQLEEYFAGERREFELPLDFRHSSAFDDAVYVEMAQIPYGEVATYGELARRIGMPRAARAVGGACNRNPLPIVIPCHRVVASDGKIGGYGGGLSIKTQLLRLEGADGLFSA